MSRRLRPSEELPDTAMVEDALAQLERTYHQSGVSAYGRVVTQEDKQTSEDLRSVPVTHRFRLFRYQCEGLEDGEFIYAEVWDTAENPSDDDLPPGQPIKTITDSSLEHVEAEANSFCKGLGPIEIADWRDFGSI